MPRTPGPLEKLLLQLNQVTQSCQQVERSPDSARPMDLAPETHCQACGRLMVMAALYQGHPVTSGQARHPLGTAAHG